jgi:7-keto-8-aminopelargonate synthetase-like enzyme
MTSGPLMQSAPGPETIIDGVSYLYFGGTSYLGLAAHPDVIAAGCAALRQYGIHSATSRAGFGTTPPVQEAEERAAEYFGTEAAFYFASGYAANHILAATFAPEVDLIAVADPAHFCVTEAARSTGLRQVRFRAEDAEDLSRATDGHRRVLVMADAVGSVTGALAPVGEYLRVLSKLGRAILLLDDAHGFGVLGDRGRGLFEELELWAHVNGNPDCDGVTLAVGGTLAKGLGGFGGIIPGTDQFIQRVRQSSHYFEGSSAPAVPVAAGSAKALEIAGAEPWRRAQVRANSAHLRRQFHQLGLSVPDGASAHFGLRIGDGANMRRIHQALKERGILLPYFAAYSGVSKDGLLRVAVFANHRRDQLERLVQEVQAVL